jgi:hypothetical protein
MAINTVYVLTEEELKQLLTEQRVICSNNYINGSDVISSFTPELPRLLTEWEVIQKIFNKKH